MKSIKVQTIIVSMIVAFGMENSVMAYYPPISGSSHVNVTKQTDITVFWSGHIYSYGKNCGNPITKKCSISNNKSDSKVKFMDGSNPEKNYCTVSFRNYGIKHIVSSGTFSCKKTSKYDVVIAS